MTNAEGSDAGASIVVGTRVAPRDVGRAVPLQALMSLDDALMAVVGEPVFQTRLLTVSPFDSRRLYPARRARPAPPM